MKIGQPIRETRRSLGVSQAALAAQAGVSLATLQNIEAGRANPSISTLEKLLAPLGLGLAVKPRSDSWDVLAALGQPRLGLPRLNPPVADHGIGGVRTVEESLLDHIHLAALDLERQPESPDHERRTECLQALLIAIRSHFPSRYTRWFHRSPLIRDLVPDEPTGRLIKLSRIARQPLAEIL